MKLTKKQQKFWGEEIRKCKGNFEYFAETYCKVFQMDSKTGIAKVKNFKLYEYQKKAIRVFQENQFTIFKKPRQMGISVIVGLYCLWIALFNEDQIIVIVSKSGKAAKDFVRKIKVAFDKLPEQIGGRLWPENTTEIGFETGSLIISKANSEDAGKGDTPTLLILDEAAAISRTKNKPDNLAEDIWVGAKPGLSLGGKGIIISTSNGAGNFYHRTWIQAKEGTSGFYPFEINWWDRPEYTIGLRKTDKSRNFPEDWTSDWLEQQIREATNFRTAITQEIFSAFLGSGKTVLSLSEINKLFNIKTPKQIAIENYLKVWELPNPTHQYVAGIDVAEGEDEVGENTDNSVIEVFNCTTNTQVAEYVSMVDGDILAEHVLKINKLYKPYFNFDRNSQGYVLSTYLKNEPISIYKTGKNQKTLGTRITGKSRSVLINLYRTLPRLRIKLYSESLKSEMETFIKKNGRADHESGCHDDRIFALLLALMIKDKAYAHQPIDVILSDSTNLYENASATRKAIEDIDKYLEEEESKKNDSNQNKYIEAMAYGMSSEYIDEYELLIGN